jgi:DNA-binding transcriptional LysR family regulator
MNKEDAKKLIESNDALAASAEKAIDALSAALQARAQLAAPTGVVLPPRMSAFADDFPERHTAAKWYNRAIDDVKTLNAALRGNGGDV